MLMVVARYVSGEWTPAAGAWTAARLVHVLALTLGAALVLGLLVYSDPLYLYLFIAPLGLLLVIRLLQDGKLRETAVLVVLGQAVLVAGLLATGFARLHFAIAKFDARFVALDQLGYHIYLAFQGLLILFNADFFGRQPLNRHTIGTLVNFGVLALIFAAPLLL